MGKPHFFRLESTEKMNTQEAINKLFEPVITAMGYEFIGCEYSASGGEINLKVYIDAKSGVTLEDCSKVSKQLSVVLDVEDPISGRYRLEISSPGLERSLFTLEHFKQFIDSIVSIRLNALIDNRRNFTGRILDVKNEQILLNVDEQTISLPFSTIVKARLVNR